MTPLDEEIFPKVKQPIFFINSEKFHWVGNISQIKKLDSAGIQRKMITIRWGHEAGAPRDPHPLWAGSPVRTLSGLRPPGPPPSLG